MSPASKAVAGGDLGYFQGHHVTLGAGQSTCVISQVLSSLSEPQRREEYVPPKPSRNPGLPQTEQPGPHTGGSGDRRYHWAGRSQ